LSGNKEEAWEIFGKNYSCKNTRLRNNRDYYQTPYGITREFMSQESFNLCEPILEPACGSGAISKVLKEFRYKVTEFDILNGTNFLKYKVSNHQLVTNPPYSLADKFINKAKQIVEYKFAMFLPLGYLHGQNRYLNKLYTDKEFPLTKVYVLTRMPMLKDSIRKDGCFSTGMQVYAWYVWEKNTHSRYPILNWLDVQKYVYSKRKKNNEIQNKTV
jgi:hypothetical protein